MRRLYFLIRFAPLASPTISDLCKNLQARQAESGPSIGFLFTPNKCQPYQ